jgi:hypothetical protein
MEMAAEWREVLAQDAEPAADLEHNVVWPEFSQTVDHAKDVGVDQEVLAKVVLGTNVEFANPAQARLNWQVTLCLGDHGAHQPNRSAALRSTKRSKLA